MAFRQRFKGEQPFESQLSIFSIPHSFARAPGVRSYGNTLRDLSLSRRIVALGDSIAQILSDRDEIEGRTGTGHSNARDGHGI